MSSMLNARGGSDLRDLTEWLAEPYATVTTEECADARRVVERAGGPGPFLEMLGIDDAGMADGLTRGIWTQS